MRAHFFRRVPALSLILSTALWASLLLAFSYFGSFVWTRTVVSRLPASDIEQAAVEECDTTSTPIGQPAAPHAPVGFLRKVKLRAIVESRGFTSSSSPSAGHSSVAIGVMPATLLFDLPFAGWVHGEHRFSLPAPPGYELLRPPQVA